MRPDTTYLRALNAEYRMWTGEGLYLSVSQTTPDQTVYSFVSGSIADLTGAEGYLRWALEAIKSGLHSHNEIIHITPNEETQA